MQRPARWGIALGLVAALFAGATLAFLASDRSGGPSGNPAHAQERPEDHGIEVRGQGDVTVVPDVAKVMIGVEIEDEDLAQVRSDANQRMDDVISGLQADGIDEEQIRTARYDIMVVENRDPEPMRDAPVSQAEPSIDGDTATTDADDENDTADDEPPRTYRLIHMINVTVDDIDHIGDVIDNALDNGANSVGKIRFEVGDPEAAIRDARERAVDHARDQADHLAELAGVSVGTPIWISESSPSLPATRMARPAVDMDDAAEDAARAPIEPGESAITVNVQIIYGIE